MRPEVYPRAAAWSAAVSYLLGVTQEAAIYVELAYDRWLRLCALVQANPGMSPSMPYGWHEVCGSVIDYLGRFRMFLDHTTAAATEEQLVEFKEAAALEYDEHVEYRLAYKLRDYSQHFALPLGSISLGSNFALTVQRDRLLEGHFNWGARVRDDLEGGPEQIDLVAIIVGSCASFRRLRTRTIQWVAEELSGAIEAAEEYWEYCRERGGTPMFVVVPEHQFTQADVGQTVQLLPVEPWLISSARSVLLAAGPETDVGS